MIFELDKSNAFAFTVDSLEDFGTYDFACSDKEIKEFFFIDWFADFYSDFIFNDDGILNFLLVFGEGGVFAGGFRVWVFPVDLFLAAIKLLGTAWTGVKTGAFLSFD